MQIYRQSPYKAGVFYTRVSVVKSTIIHPASHHLPPSCDLSACLSVCASTCLFDSSILPLQLTGWAGQPANASQGSDNIAVARASAGEHAGSNCVIRLKEGHPL